MTIKQIETDESTLRALSKGSLGFASKDSPEDVTIRNMAKEILELRAEVKALKIQLDAANLGWA